MRKLEHEFNLKLDEMRNAVLTQELKVQLLNKELNVHAKGRSEAVEALQLSEQLCQQAQKEILHRDWDLKNTSAIKDSRHAELERRVREKETALEALKEAHAFDLHEEKKKATELQLQLDSLVLENEKSDNRHTDEVSHKEQQIQELRTQLEKMKASWDAYIAQVSKETVAKDTELLSAREREAKIKAELQKCKEAIERYKQQLASAVQREEALEQKRVQVELELERRCEEIRAEHYLKSEELIHGLTQSRDKVIADLREKEQELQETIALLKSVTMERDQAQRGLTSNTLAQEGLKSNSFPSEEIRRLQQQNSSLREVITEMRRQMEALNTEVPLPQNSMTVKGDPIPSSTTAGFTEYNQALEKELQNLKAKCRHLEDQLEEASRTTVHNPQSANVLAVSPDNAYLQNHIRTLNETIGGLRAEKIANVATLKKQEVRLAYLESMVNQLTQQCHSRQMETEALRLELANQKREAAAEEASLKQRLNAAEMQIEEVKREAEEYQKGSVLHNLESVALGNQSEMVKQLQDENLSLRQQLLLQVTDRGSDCGNLLSLQTKLKKAARLISRLSQDKQQLIEMGNRLRAQLIHLGSDDLQQIRPRSKPSLCEKEKEHTNDDSEALPRNRFSALEQLQYKLTTQELQFAQRYQSKKNPITVRSLSGSGSEASDVNPWDPPARPRNQDLQSKENTPPGKSNSKGSVNQASPSQTLLSSVATDESLQDVWKMLEHNRSPGKSENQDIVPVSAKAEIHRNTPHPELPVQVQGSKAAIQERSKQARATSEPCKRARSAGKAVKIRNYNMKD
ncbi:Coiled-coil domain-containing protein 57 [Bagarius yarrelli]|uniref:Coiled-coil domain-containing protein 57 n=1 Tax=Bagarius yarrelli TaxID=175774 RepID=A0A556TJA6_BAGYA|nr:Coiled-coil domain-containing protein 57 [Bagarius yarrelli]